MVKVGDVVKVFGHKISKVVDVSTNTAGVVKNVKVSGAHNGWTKVGNVRPVTA